MRKVANRNAKELEELFKETSAEDGRFNEAIVEKDFWVCVMLDHLFRHCQYKDSFTFKGGTSLSKAWNVIDRFSEDIDLILDWRVLGYDKDEPNKPRSSRHQQDRFNDEANKKAAQFVGNELIGVLRDEFAQWLGREHEFEIDADNPQTILFHYPKIFRGNGLQQTIRLEIGPLAAWTPAQERSVSPYAAERYPQVFEYGTTLVRTVSAERTFWEKATILHKIAHFPEGKRLPARYARHYYDIFCFCRSEFKQKALEQKELLETVAEFKRKFYPSSGAKYEFAKVGTLKLMPPAYIRGELKRDYDAMREMIYGACPGFDVILDCVGDLEDEINALSLL